MNNILKEILQESMDKKKIIGIRIYDNDDFLFTGYILDYNDKTFQIRHFTDYGKDDGTVIERTENISNIEFNEDYYDCLEYLVQINEELDKLNSTNIKYNLSNNWHFDVLSEFVGKKIIVAVENQKKENILGFITKLTESELIINTIGDLGQDEGLSYYKLQDINSIQPDDLECRKRLALYKWRNKK